MKGQVCEGKTCGMGGCCCGHGGWYRVIRWVLGIAIIMIVFCFGMMIGQLKGELGSGRRMMRMPSYGGYGRAYPMMQNGSASMMGGTPTKVTPPTSSGQ